MVGVTVGVDVGIDVEVDVDVGAGVGVDVGAAEKNSFPSIDVLGIDVVKEDSIRIDINNAAAAETVTKATAAAMIRRRFRGDRLPVSPSVRAFGCSMMPVRSGSTSFVSFIVLI